MAKKMVQPDVSALVAKSIHEQRVEAARNAVETIRELVETMAAGRTPNEEAIAAAATACVLLGIPPSSPMSDVKVLERVAELQRELVKLGASAELHDAVGRCVQREKDLTQQLRQAHAATVEARSKASLRAATESEVERLRRENPRVFESIERYAERVVARKEQAEQQAAENARKAEIANVPRGDVFTPFARIGRA